MKNSKDRTNALREIVSKYEKLELQNGQEIHCPYWINRIKNGKVYIRGQYNGKGTWQDIQKVLNQALKNENINEKILSKEEFQKLAKRHRIGIDCSGYVYRILEHLEEKKCIQNFSLSFPEGVNRTNANMLTSADHSMQIEKTEDIKPLDLVRLMGGKHLLLILQNDGKKIEYTHASSLTTRKKGVHREYIYILDSQSGLEYQSWQEKTGNGENYGKKYYKPDRGDGVKRLSYSS